MAYIDKETRSSVNKFNLSFSHEGHTFSIQPTIPQDDNTHVNVAFNVLDENGNLHGGIGGLLTTQDGELIFRANSARNVFSNAWGEGNPRHITRVIAAALGHLAMRVDQWHADPVLLTNGRSMYEYLLRESLRPASPFYGRFTVTPVSRVFGGESLPTYSIIPSRRERPE